MSFQARREEKKVTKLAFKSEKQKQEKDLINVRQAKQGVRIVWLNQNILLVMYTIKYC